MTIIEPGEVRELGSTSREAHLLAGSHERLRMLLTQANAEREALRSMWRGEGMTDVEITEAVQLILTRHVKA